MARTLAANVLDMLMRGRTVSINGKKYRMSKRRKLFINEKRYDIYGREYTWHLADKEHTEIDGFIRLCETMTPQEKEIFEMQMDWSSET